MIAPVALPPWPQSRLPPLRSLDRNRHCSGKMRPRGRRWSQLAGIATRRKQQGALVHLWQPQLTQKGTDDRSNRNRRALAPKCQTGECESLGRLNDARHSERCRHR